MPYPKGVSPPPADALPEEFPTSSGSPTPGGAPPSALPSGEASVGTGMESGGTANAPVTQTGPPPAPFRHRPLVRKWAAAVAPGCRLRLGSARSEHLNRVKQSGFVIFLQAVMAKWVHRNGQITTPHTITESGKAARTVPAEDKIQSAWKTTTRGLSLMQRLQPVPKPSPMRAGSTYRKDG